MWGGGGEERVKEENGKPNDGKWCEKRERMVGGKQKESW